MACLLLYKTTAPESLQIHIKQNITKQKFVVEYNSKQNAIEYQSLEYKTEYNTYKTEYNTIQNRI